MIIYLDRETVARARFITESRDTPDVRRYYLVSVPDQPDAIIVCRNGLALPGLAGQRVDVNVGWDVAQPGFAVEEDIGKQRTKVTIRKPVRAGRCPSLGELLAREGRDRG